MNISRGSQPVGRGLVTVATAFSTSHTIERAICIYALIAFVHYQTATRLIFQPETYLRTPHCCVKKWSCVRLPCTPALRSDSQTRKTAVGFQGTATLPVSHWIAQIIVNIINYVCNI
jgi:hypothetical protein